MKKAGRPNAMLIELIIVLLFFSLSAAIILQVFVATHNKSVRSKVDSAALMMAEDLADRFYVSELDTETFFAAAGWKSVDGRHERQLKVENRALLFVIGGEHVETAAGMLDDLTITIYDGETEIVTLPMARYQPGEVPL